MIFSSPRESASLLAQKLLEDNLASDSLLTYINPDASRYCQLVGQSLGLPSQELHPYILGSKEISTRRVIIVDSGDTRGSEYVEYTDRLRVCHPQIQLVIAVPVIPVSEKPQLVALCDSLIFLHADPYFFSVTQFYQSYDQNT